MQDTPIHVVSHLFSKPNCRRTKKWRLSLSQCSQYKHQWLIPVLSLKMRVTTITLCTVKIIKWHLRLCHIGHCNLLLGTTKKNIEVEGGPLLRLQLFDSVSNHSYNAQWSAALYPISLKHPTIPLTGKPILLVCVTLMKNRLSKKKQKAIFPPYL